LLEGYRKREVRGITQSNLDHSGLASAAQGEKKKTGHQEN